MKQRKVLAFLLIFNLSFISIFAQRSAYYEVKTYYFKSSEQEKLLDQYIQAALIPALHENGMGPVGAFKPIANDTAALKRIILIMSAKKLETLSQLEEKLLSNASYQTKASNYLQAPYNSAAYGRIEKVWLKAFKMAKQPTLPVLKSALTEHVYELRSYESPSETYYRNKLHMFNEGQEITLFKDLNFNATFYGDVIAGAHMPNLMYMTSFENMNDRNEHWKAFSASVQWKKLSSDPFYKNNVSKSEITLMKAAEYSEY